MVLHRHIEGMPIQLHHLTDKEHSAKVLGRGVRGRESGRCTQGGTAPPHRRDDPPAPSFNRFREKKTFFLKAGEKWNRRRKLNRFSSATLLKT